MYSLTKFPAADGTPSAPADDQHSRQWCAQNSRGRVRGSATGEVQRPSAPGRLAGESPPPPPRRTPLDNRSTSRGGDGCVKRRAVAGSPAPWRTCQSRHAARRRDAIADRTDRMLGMGDHRPTVGRARMMAVGTFDVCSNAAVNSDLSCFLYTL